MNKKIIENNERTKFVKFSFRKREKFKEQGCINTKNRFLRDLMERMETEVRYARFSNPQALAEGIGVEIVDDGQAVEIPASCRLALEVAKGFLKREKNGD